MKRTTSYLFPNGKGCSDGKHCPFIQLGGGRLEQTFFVCKGHVNEPEERRGDRIREGGAAGAGRGGGVGG